MPITFSGDRTPFYASLGLLSYFALLLLVNHFKWGFVLIGVFVELLTLPALAALIGLFVYSCYRSFWGAKAQRPVYRMTAGVLVICVLMLVAATV